MFTPSLYVLTTLDDQFNVEDLTAATSRNLDLLTEFVRDIVWVYRNRAPLTLGGRPIGRELIR